MDLEAEIANIKFRMDLLFDNTELSRLYYEVGLTEAQYNSIRSLFANLRKRIDNNEKISSSEYEHELLSIVDRRKLDYHFAESVAELLWEDNRYEEVFEMVYASHPRLGAKINKE